MIYLPRAKMAIEADHVSPRGGQVRAAPAVREFVQAVDKLNLDIQTVSGIHGDSVAMEAVRAAVKGGQK